MPSSIPRPLPGWQSLSPFPLTGSWYKRYSAVISFVQWSSPIHSICWTFRAIRYLSIFCELCTALLGERVNNPQSSINNLIQSLHIGDELHFEIQMLVTLSNERETMNTDLVRPLTDYYRHIEIKITPHFLTSKL